MSHIDDPRGPEPIDAEDGAVAAATRAALAARDGDFDHATAHLREAQIAARSTARRERQIVEIVSLLIAGDHARAVGLSLEHRVSYPGDVGLLQRITGTDRPPPAD